MKFIIIFFILFLALFLETTVVALPLVLLSLLFLVVLFQEYWIFLVACIMGVCIDVLTFRPLGVSSIFFILTLGVIFLYKRKYEIQSLPFVSIFTTIASMLYLSLSGISSPLLQGIVSGVLAGGIFFLFTKVSVKHSSQVFRKSFNQ